MKPIAIVILGLLLPTSLCAKDDLLVALYERDPWLTVIGADSPTFALYRNGLVLFLDKPVGEGGVYQSVELPARDVDRFLGQLDSLEGLESQYELSRWTDQPTQELVYKYGSSTRTIRVYGDLRRREEVRASAPEAFLSIYQELTAYRNAAAKVWHPDFIEVMIWPYDHAPEESIIWPDHWPGLEAESTRRRGDSYSLYLPYGQGEELSRFLNRRRDRGAVEIAGKKWAISTRWPFPHEVAPN